MFGIGPYLIYGIAFLNALVIILTAVLINTEEKWLLEVYGDEYAEYKSRVNRCIPWRSKS